MIQFSYRSLWVISLHVLLTVALAAVSALAGYVILYEALGAERARSLQAYIDVRADREQILFDDALALNQAAARVFRRRLAVIDAQTVNEQFDSIYPDHGDGTRRSDPSLFDGRTLPGGDTVFGIGAFLGDGGEMTVEEKRRYLAAFHAVRIVGEAHLGQFSSLYYFTPDRRAVLFAPHREDRLEFYRFEAPADFQLQADEDPRLFNPATNPNNEMQCTQLSRYLYHDGGERAATACRMPLRDGEELLGAFGTSIQMSGHIARALEEPPAHGLNMLFDREGQTIARGQTGRVDDRLPVDPANVMALLADDPRPRGIVRGPDEFHVVAFSRVDGPDWYFVSVVSLVSLHRTATGWAWVLFGIVFVASLSFASLRGLLRRWQPVRRLMRRQRPDKRPGQSPALRRQSRPGPRRTAE